LATSTASWRFCGHYMLTEAGDCHLVLNPLVFQSLISPLLFSLFAHQHYFNSSICSKWEICWVNFNSMSTPLFLSTVMAVWGRITRGAHLAIFNIQTGHPRRCRRNAVKITFVGTQEMDRGRPGRRSTCRWMPVLFYALLCCVVPLS
jgi:hypothetical protein